MLIEHSRKNAATAGRRIPDPPERELAIGHRPLTEQIRSLPSWGMLILLALLAASCRKPRDVRENATTENLRKENRFVSEFQTLYPDSVGYFTHYEDDYGPLTWHARIGLEGRLVLNMTIELKPSEDRLHFPESCAPKFTLLEVESLVKTENGAIKVKYKEAFQIEFGPLEWQSLRDRKGDLSVLGVGAGSGPPIPDFDKLWKEF